MRTNDEKINAIDKLKIKNANKEAKYKEKLKAATIMYRLNLSNMRLHYRNDIKNLELQKRTLLSRIDDLTKEYDYLYERYSWELMERPRINIMAYQNLTAEAEKENSDGK